MQLSVPFLHVEKIWRKCVWNSLDFPMVSKGKYESTWAACQPTLHGRHSLHEVTKFDHNYFHNKKSLKKFWSFTHGFFRGVLRWEAWKSDRNSFPHLAKKFSKPPKLISKLFLFISKKLKFSSDFHEFYYIFNIATMNFQFNLKIEEFFAKRGIRMKVSLVTHRKA